MYTSTSRIAFTGTETRLLFDTTEDTTDTIIGNQSIVATIRIDDRILGDWCTLPTIGGTIDHQPLTCRYKGGSHGITQCATHGEITTHTHTCTRARAPSLTDECCVVLVPLSRLAFFSLSARARRPPSPAAIPFPSLLFSFVRLVARLFDRS